MSSNETFMSDEAAINLVKALAIEVTEHGSKEADLMLSNSMTEEEIMTVMKANTFLSAFSGVLIQIVEKHNPGFARLVVDTWTSTPIQNLVRLAFTEEIEKAASEVQASILRLENEINKEE